MVDAGCSTHSVLGSRWCANRAGPAIFVSRKCPPLAAFTIGPLRASSPGLSPRPGTPCLPRNVAVQGAGVPAQAPWFAEPSDHSRTSSALPPGSYPSSQDKRTNHPMLRAKTITACPPLSSSFAPPCARKTTSAPCQFREVVLWYSVHYITREPGCQIAKNAKNRPRTI